MSDSFITNSKMNVSLKHSSDSEFINVTRNAVSVISNENDTLHRIIFNNKNKYNFQ